MTLLNYAQLTAEQQQVARAFFSAHKGIAMEKTDQEIEALMTMTDLNGGELMFTAWRGETLLATLGVVTAAIERKGEAYLTAFSAADSQESREGFEALLNHIQTAVIESAQEGRRVLLKLGIGPKLEFMAGPVKALGFESLSNMVHMSRPGEASLIKGLHMLPLSEAWLSAYEAIQNETFAEVPNGAMESEETLREWLEDAAENEWRGLLFEPSSQETAADPAHKGGLKPVGFYELSMKAESGVQVGWIDAVGILKADRGKGYGQLALHALCAFLMEQGAERTDLLVMDANRAAYQLYQREGFITLGIYNQWMGKPC